MNRHDRKAFRELDVKAVRKSAAKRTGRIMNDETALILCHKMRLNVAEVGASVEQRMESREWLIHRGYRTTFHPKAFKGEHNDLLKRD